MCVCVCVFNVCVCVCVFNVCVCVCVFNVCVCVCVFNVCVCIDLWDVLTGYGYQMISEDQKEPEIVKDSHITTITVSFHLPLL